MAVIQSYFTPMTFDEMIKPLQMYGEEFNRQEELYNTLGEDASLWESMLDPTEDREAYDMWNNFNTKYTEGVDSLMNHGLKGSRRKLMTARRSYNQNIKPLLEAKTKMDSFIDQRNTAKANNPDLEFEKEDVRIGDFLKGHRPNVNAMDGKQVEEEMAAIATSLGKAFTKDLHAQSVYKGYIDFCYQNGFDANLLDAIQSDAFLDKLKPAELTIKKGEKGYDQAARAYQEQEENYKRYKAAADAYKDLQNRVRKYSPDAQERLLYKGRVGFYAGIGQTTHNPQDDKNVMSAYQRGELAQAKYATDVQAAVAREGHQTQRDIAKMNEAGANYRAELNSRDQKEANALQYRMKNMELLIGLGATPKVDSHGNITGLDLPKNVNLGFSKSTKALSPNSLTIFTGGKPRAIATDNNYNGDVSQFVKNYNYSLDDFKAVYLQNTNSGVRYMAGDRDVTNILTPEEKATVVAGHNVSILDTRNASTVGKALTTRANHVVLINPQKVVDQTDIRPYSGTSDSSFGVVSNQTPVDQRMKF